MRNRKEGAMGTCAIGGDCRQFDSTKSSERQFVGVSKCSCLQVFPRSPNGQRIICVWRSLSRVRPSTSLENIAIFCVGMVFGGCRLDLKQANACLSELDFRSAGATWPAGLV